MIEDSEVTVVAKNETCHMLAKQKVCYFFSSEPCYLTLYGIRVKYCNESNQIFILIVLGLSMYDCTL